MPASTAATAPTITDGSNRIAPITMATRTPLPPTTAIRPAKMNLRQLSILAANSSICASSRTISSPWSLSFMVDAAKHYQRNTVGNCEEPALDTRKRSRFYSQELPTACDRYCSRDDL